MKNNKKWFITLATISIVILIFSLLWTTVIFVNDFTDKQQDTANVEQYIREDLSNTRKILYDNKNFFRRTFSYEEWSNYIIYEKWDLKIKRKNVKIEREVDPLIWEWFRITAVYWINDDVERQYRLYELRNYYDIIDTTPTCTLVAEPWFVNNWEDVLIKWSTMNAEIVKVENKTFNRFISNSANWSSIIEAEYLTQSWPTNFLLTARWNIVEKAEDWEITERPYDYTCNIQVLSN